MLGLLVARVQASIFIQIRHDARERHVSRGCEAASVSARPRQLSIGYGASAFVAAAAGAQLTVLRRAA